MVPLRDFCCLCYECLWAKSISPCHPRSADTDTGTAYGNSSTAYANTGTAYTDASAANTNTGTVNANTGTAGGDHYRHEHCR
jgi:hypothetical protein